MRMAVLLMLVLFFSSWLLISFFFSCCAVNCLQVFAVLAFVLLVNVKNNAQKCHASNAAHVERKVEKMKPPKKQELLRLSKQKHTMVHCEIGSPLCSFVTVTNVNMFTRPACVHGNYKLCSHSLVAANSKPPSPTSKQACIQKKNQTDTCCCSHKTTKQNKTKQGDEKRQTNV